MSLASARRRLRRRTVVLEPTLRVAARSQCGRQWPPDHSGTHGCCSTGPAPRRLARGPAPVAACFSSACLGHADIFVLCPNILDLELWGERNESHSPSYRFALEAGRPAVVVTASRQRRKWSAGKREHAAASAAMEAPVARDKDVDGGWRGGWNSGDPFYTPPLLLALARNDGRRRGGGARADAPVRGSGGAAKGDGSARAGAPRRPHRPHVLRGARGLRGCRRPPRGHSWWGIDRPLAPPPPPGTATYRKKERQRWCFVASRVVCVGGLRPAPPPSAPHQREGAAAAGAGRTAETRSDVYQTRRHRFRKRFERGPRRRPPWCRWRVDPRGRRAPSRVATCFGRARGGTAVPNAAGVARAALAVVPATARAGSAAAAPPGARRAAVGGVGAASGAPRPPRRSVLFRGIAATHVK